MKAYELLATPDKWTRGADARDKDDNPVRSRDREACCWCAVGAIKACYWPFEVQDATFNRLTSAIGRLIEEWNDAPGRTHAEIIAMLKKADV